MKTNMRNTAIALVLSLFTVAQVFAATTGSITLSGSVNAATALVVTGVGGYNNLDLTTTQTNLQVATIREINNTTNGYVVKMSSANGGALKNGTAGSITYTAKYNGASANLAVAPVTVTSSPAANTVVNITKPLTISYTGVAAETLMAGTYSDTLTFTITAN